MVNNIERLIEDVEKASLRTRIFSWKRIREQGEVARQDTDRLVHEQAAAKVKMSEYEDRGNELDRTREELAQVNAAYYALVKEQKEKVERIVELERSERFNLASIQELKFQLSLATSRPEAMPNEIHADGIHSTDLRPIDANAIGQSETAVGQGANPFVGIDKAHIESALKTIDLDGVPKGRLPKRWVLKNGSSDYPPKYVLFIAGLSVHGATLNRGQFETGQPNEFLTKLGYTIIDKNTGMPWE